MSLFRSSFLVFLFFSSHVSTAQTNLSAWSCIIPCVEIETKKVIKLLQLGYCSDQIDEKRSFGDFTKECRRETGREDIEATPYVESWKYPYSCRTAHNSCTKAGPVKLNFTCRFECAPSTNLTYGAVCSYNHYEAWRLATKGCAEPRIQNPEITSFFDVCSPDGYKMCLEP